MDTSALVSLSSHQLAALTGSLRSGALAHNFSQLSLQTTAPSLNRVQIKNLLDLSEDGWTTDQISLFLRTLQKTHQKADPLSNLVDLVISGPSMPQVPTRSTKAVFNELVAGIEEEVLIVSFAIYNGKTLLKPLAEKLEENPKISAKFVLNIPRGRNDKTLSNQLISRFKDDFVNKVWPGKVYPEIFHFPQSLEQNWKERASLHSKVIVVDRKRLFISSANLTDAAHNKNIETGLVLEHPASAERLVTYFDALIAAENLEAITFCR